MAFYKSRRAARYHSLRRMHFSSVESQAFSVLPKTYPALKAMAKQRSAQWAGFTKAARARGWGHSRFAREWREFIHKRYEAKDWLATKNVRGKEYKRPRPNPWKWYDDTLQGLPPWDQWDSPRSHRKKGGGPLKLDKVSKQKWVGELNRSIREARGDPARQRQLREQKRRLLNI